MRRLLHSINAQRVTTVSPVLEVKDMVENKTGKTLLMPSFFTWWPPLQGEWESLGSCVVGGSERQTTMRLTPNGNIKVQTPLNHLQVNKELWRVRLRSRLAWSAEAGQAWAETWPGTCQAPEWLSADGEGSTCVKHWVRMLKPCSQP